MRVSARSFPSLVLALLAAGLLVTLAAPGAQAAAPTILLLHGGGWMSGTPSTMIPWQNDFRAHGYRTRLVAYPFDVTRSIDHVAAIVQEERLRGASVIAYGTSAGGTIAAALAATGRVDGAVNISGPTDFTRWISPTGLLVGLDMSTAEKRAASPYWRLNGRQSPQLLQCGWADPVTTYDQCTRYVSRARAGNPDTTLHAVLNVHSQWESDRDRARDWVQERWPAARSAGRKARRPLLRLPRRAT